MPSRKTPQTTIGRRISAPAVLDDLETESFEIFREPAAAFRKSVMRHSIGKDSSVLTHLARKGEKEDSMVKKKTEECS